MLPNYREQDCCANCTHTEYSPIFIYEEEAKVRCHKHQKDVYVQFICDDYEGLWIGESDGN
jgi:hypothetical protein